MRRIVVSMQLSPNFCTRRWRQNEFASRIVFISHLSKKKTYPTYEYLSYMILQHLLILIFYSTTLIVTCQKRENVKKSQRIVG